MAAALLATAACGGSTQGQGTPTATGAASSDTGSSQDTSSSGSTNGTLTSDACSLMTQSEATQHGATSSGQAGTVAGYPDCNWDFGTTSVRAAIFANKGVSQLSVTGPVTDLGVIGSHHAQQMTNNVNTSGCQIAFAVTPTSSVLVTVQEATSISTASVCQDTKTIATVVEKHLPSS